MDWLFIWKSPLDAQIERSRKRINLIVKAVKTAHEKRLQLISKGETDQEVLNKVYNFSALQGQTVRRPKSELFEAVYVTNAEVKNVVTVYGKTLDSKKYGRDLTYGFASIDGFPNVVLKQGDAWIVPD